ncbi:MAG TPA: branched-chain amino acid ABC transporter permease [Thermodesulfobacteriota bacterium]|nr:branched-chain amino acid ABC transporter permease [Thermodesulfobacteriota bacterium]
MKNFVLTLLGPGPLGPVLALVFLLFLPLFIGESWVSLMVEMMALAIFATSLNILIGYGGMVSFGHAAYYGIGAYTYALLLTKAAAPFLLAMIAAPILSALGALIIGCFCVRLSHIYFSMLTLAFGQIVFAVALQWYGFTRGDNGITEIPFPPLLQSTQRFYYFALVVLALSLWGMKRIVDSPFGKTLQALRDNPLRTEFMGINVRLYSLMAFVIAGGFAGIGGALYAAFNHNVFPTFMHWGKSTEALVVTLLGGMFHFFGPAVGSILLIFLDKIVTSYLRYWSFVLGILLALMVLFFRGGFSGYVMGRLNAMGDKRGESR